MASYVAKVQFENSLRRLSLGSDATTVSFSQLVARTRDLFQISATAKLSLKYVDRDGDVVTMVDDQDLQDALVMQSLNPLRLTVAIVGDGVQVQAPEANVAAKNVPTAENVEELKEGIQQKPTESRAEATPAAAEPSTEEKSNVDAAAVTGAEQQQEEVVSEKNVEEPLPGNTGKVEGDETAAAKSSKGAAAGSEAASEQPVHYGIVCDGCNMRYIKGTRYKSLSKTDYDLCQACFEKPGVNRNEFVAFRRGRPCVAGMFMRGGSRNGCVGACPRMEKGTEKEPTAAAEGEAVHFGVVCDECNTTPIVGPRFKSNKKDDYDLCQSCMQKVESSTSDEYTRIDQAAAQFHPHMFVGRPFRVFPPYAMFPFMPFGRPWYTRRIYVSGGVPEENEAAAAQQEVKKDGEREQKPAADTPASENIQSKGQPESEKTQSEAQAVVGTQDAVVANTEEKNVNAQVGESQSASEVPVSDESQKGDDVVAQQQASEDISSFEGMVAKLAAMGFTDSKLNEELLRKNNLDLRMTLDDLCAAEEWDPMLEELQEMGFYDTDMNRRLLVQKNGNLKSVLKELVRLAKLGAGKPSKGEKEA